MDKKILVILFLLIALAILAAWLKGSFNAPPVTGVRVRLGEHEYEVDIADTIPLQTQGLSGRQSLAASHGMLFVFNPPRAEAFWMHAMNFPIDIIWINNGVVTGFAQNAPAPTPGESDFNLPMYDSPGPVTHVLEVPAGTVAAGGIVVGTAVSISGY